MNRSNTKRGSVSWCFIWMGEGMIFKHRHWTWFSSWCLQFIWKNPRTPTSHIWRKAHPGYFTHEPTPSGPRNQPISLPYPRSGHLGCRPTASSQYWRNVSPLSAQPGSKAGCVWERELLPPILWYTSHIPWIYHIIYLECTCNIPLSNTPFINGHFRNLNWRYLPYIRPV